MKQQHLVFFLLASLLLGSCRQDPMKPQVDYETLPAISGDLVNMVVEIPAGTNHKIEYQYAAKVFQVDTLNGQDRVIDFLPYPGNYGFIPGTLMDKARGGDGDALDILLISEAIPTGTVVGVKPIGALLLRDRGEIDTKIIAIPVDRENQVVGADNFIDFMLYYDAARRILEDWFTNYKGQGIIELIRWEDERYAWQEIQKWEMK